MTDSPLESFAKFAFGSEIWMQDAECRKLPLPAKERLKLFFPGRGGSRASARAICLRCEVSVECKEYADRSNTLYGMWGGEMRKRGRLPEDGEDLDELELDEQEDDLDVEHALLVIVVRSAQTYWDTLDESLLVLVERMARKHKEDGLEIPVGLFRGDL